MISKEEAEAIIPILQAIVEGKQLQYKEFSDTPWVDVSEHHNFQPTIQYYRVKPSVKRYRMYLNKYPAYDHQTLHMVSETGNVAPESVENTSVFVRWIHTKWQEVEV